MYAAAEAGLVQGVAERRRRGGTRGAAGRGRESFLDACIDPAVQRIVLLDAPSVLGWSEWREIGMRYGLGLVEGAGAGPIDAGLLEPGPADRCARALGALDEGAMLVARADDAGQTRRQVGASVARMLDSLRARG